MSTGGSLSGGPLSRGCLCLGVSVQGGLCLEVSVQGWGGGLCPGVGDLCPGVGSVSRMGVCVQGVSVWGGLCPGGVSVQFFHRNPCYSNTQVHPYNSCLTQVSSVIINLYDDGN